MGLSATLRIRRLCRCSLVFHSERPSGTNRASWFQEHFDGSTFVHGFVSTSRLNEWQFQVKDPPWIDLAFQYEFN
jgi:hypothetical protein